MSDSFTHIAWYYGDNDFVIQTFDFITFRCSAHDLKLQYMYRIVGDFREGAIFATHDQNAKIRTAKYETTKI